MGARLKEGRFFTAADRADTQDVIVIDDIVARQWPGQSAIGKRIEAEHVTRQGFQPVWSVVVGVIAHIQNHSLTDPVRGQIYMPYEQSPRSPLTFVIRTTVPPETLSGAVRATIHKQAKNAAIAKMRPMADYVAREISPSSFTAILAAIFGALSVVLAATGIYGVLNYQVSRRLPEMGLRLALGARAADVLGLVMGQAAVLAVAGAALGIVLALAASGLFSSLIFGVSPHDPVSFVFAVAALLPAVLAGCWRPARKAAAADPAETIREE
jgi:hypothetical protein